MPVNFLYSLKKTGLGLMIPCEQRGYEKVESLKREEIHSRFHKREQMHSSLEPPLSGRFPDVGFFFSPNFADGGALEFCKNGQMVGHAQRGPRCRRRAEPVPGLRSPWCWLFGH